MSSRPWSPHAALFLMACLILFGASCRRKTEAVAPVEPPKAAATERPQQEPAAPTKAAPPPDCTEDFDCQGYLRCIDGVCKSPPAVEGVATEGMPEATFVKDGGEIARFKLELAVKPHERTRGLMYRRKMHPDFGMLFVFERDSLRSFWMKNTYIPLDMVHIDSHGKVVGVVANAEPMTTNPRETGKPARYVLELVAGKAAEKGIEEGVTMQLENVPDGFRPE